MSNDIKEHYSDNITQTHIKEIMAAAFKINGWARFCLWFKNLYVVLNSPTKTPHYESCLKSLLDICCDVGDILKDDDSIQCKSNIFRLDYASTDNALFRISPFFRFLQGVAMKEKEKNIQDDDEYSKNMYFNAEFFNVVMEKYVPYVSLWSTLMLEDNNRKSNAPIERFFGIVKNSMLKKHMRQKCSRVIRKIRKYVLFIYKEEKLEMKNKNVGSKRRTKRKEKCADEGLASQENWQKKRKKKETNFNGSTLTKILNSRNKSNGTVDPCLYCGVGLLDQTAIWYGCDKSEGWVHALCENNPPENESDKYFCKFCLAAKEKEYKKSLDELLDIERETRNQSECPLWFEERHKRITASFFGKVVKASQNSTLEKLALKIITQPKVTSEPISHGKINESSARIAYENINNIHCETAGLVIHEDFQYIAGSPDGLVGENGIIEIKCPFKIRNMDPDIAIKQGLLPYVDKASGKLKTSHEYYYQVQGLLEITNSDWCDFIIYTFRVIKTERIARDKNTWEVILNKVQRFFNFYMLPHLACITKTPLLYKWRSENSINILYNGLVADHTFYRNIGKNYIIAHFEELSCTVNEVTSDDFQILSTNQWLTNFLIDIYLNLLNSANQEYQADTPNILDPEDFLCFWIRWKGPNITVGKEHEKAFLDWTDKEEVTILYAGICTGLGATGLWIIDSPLDYVFSPVHATFSETKLETEDKLEYKFFPNSTGIFQFKVKATNDATIALTTKPEKSNPMYEIIIGGWGNTSSAIRKNKTKPDVVVVETKDILDDKEFRGFWIIWQNKHILVGKENEVKSFLSWTDVEVVDIQYVGVCTAYGATGSWSLQTVKDPEIVDQPHHKFIPITVVFIQPDLETKENLGYNFFSNASGLFKFKVKAPNDAHIALTTVAAEHDPMFEIFIGCDKGTKSVIRKNRTNVAEADTPNILDPGKLRGFWIRWDNKIITVGRENGDNPFLKWVSEEDLDFKFVGVRTVSGATGAWEIDLVGDAPAAVKKFTGYWVPAKNGQAPPKAFPAGEDHGEKVFVARSHIIESIIPGKLVPSHGVCYSPAVGWAFGVPDYEVLSNYPGKWMPCSGGKIPLNALAAGHTKSETTLYVGRFSVDGVMTVGKVENGVCYIPHEGKEKDSKTFDILVHYDCAG
ncbi:hypothetical protein JTB14_018095 [Gonioctena quinquepunctata]|nr:hypothetical protein JTB14_018095 [Gonioctena quinquepunctata]